MNLAARFLDTVALSFTQYARLLRANRALRDARRTIETLTHDRMLLELQCQDLMKTLEAAAKHDAKEANDEAERKEAEARLSEAERRFPSPPPFLNDTDTQVSARP